MGLKDIQWHGQQANSWSREDMSEIARQAVADAIWIVCNARLYKNTPTSNAPV